MACHTMALQTYDHFDTQTYLKRNFQESSGLKNAKNERNSGLHFVFNFMFFACNCWNELNAIIVTFAGYY